MGNQFTLLTSKVERSHFQRTYSQFIRNQSNYFVNGKIQLITDFTSCRLQAVVLSSVRPEVPSTSERVKRTFGQTNIVNYTYFEAPSHYRISMVIIFQPTRASWVGNVNSTLKKV